jgi:hypothetical protein
MHKLIRFILAPLAGLGLILGLTIGGTAPASAVSHALVIKHKSNDNDVLMVCKDWERGQPSVSSACHTRVANLPKGKNTKDLLGWSDTDGVGIRGHKVLMQSKTGPDRAVFTNCENRTRFIKIPASLLGGSKTFYVVSGKNVCG